MEITQVLEFWIDGQNDHHMVASNHESIENLWFILSLRPPFYLKKMVWRKLDDPKSVVKSWERDNETDS